MAELYDWVGMLLKNAKVVGAIYLMFASSLGLTTCSYFDAVETGEKNVREVAVAFQSVIIEEVVLPLVQKGKTVEQHEKEEH